MIVWDLFVMAFQAVVVFVVATALFDALHWALHRWQHSRFRLLRLFSSWHWVHHRFLGRDMQVDPALARQNIWAHVVPEYATTVLGMAAFLLVFDWPAVALAVGVRTLMLVMTVREEGIDYNHMAMDRVGARQGFWWADNNYHAMHHIHPNNFFSSFANVFDLIFAKSCQIEGRRFLVTGAGGAYGSAMVRRLEAMGAIVETARSGTDYAPGRYQGMDDKLARADVLILAHGAKTEGCWSANHESFVALIDRFIELGRERLTPPEVWALGSEVELHGDMGLEELRDYSASKRAFAAHARARYYRCDALIYRHVVPSAFTSSMGKGAMSADTAVAITLFFVRRGLRYVPVTLTTLAFWNYFRFRYFQKPVPALEPAE